MYVLLFFLHLYRVDKRWMPLPHRYHSEPAGVITVFGITFFVTPEYHAASLFARGEITQITSVKMV